MSTVVAELVSTIGWLSPGVKPVSRLTSGFTSMRMMPSDAIFGFT